VAGLIGCGHRQHRLPQERGLRRAGRVARANSGTRTGFDRQALEHAGRRPLRTSGPCAQGRAALAGARQEGRAGSGAAHRRSPTRCAPNVMQRTCACGQAAAAKVAASRASAPPSANPAATTRAGASPPDTSRAACAPRPPLLARASRGALRRRGSLRGARACQHCRHCRQATEEGAPEVAGVARAADAYAGRP